MNSPEQVNDQEQPSQLVGPDGVTPAAQVAAAAPAEPTPGATMPEASDAPPVTGGVPAVGTVGAINRVSAVILPLLKTGLESMNPLPAATDVQFTLASICAQAAINTGMREADLRVIVFRAIQIQYAQRQVQSRVITPDFSQSRRGGGRRG